MPNPPTIRELMADADRRIDACRKADLTVRVTDAAGRPVRGAKVRIEQQRHEFLFGCIMFGLPEGSADKDDEAHKFLGLFNYATLPFYWGSYEPRKGKERREALQAIARWCAAHGVATKGHPLVWFEVYPKWAASLDDPIKWNQQRVGRIMRDFAGSPGAHGQHLPGLVERWDVINESTVADRHDNAFRQWFKRDGAATMTRQALTWARRANPRATLLVNDFNIGPAYEVVLDEVVPAGLCDAIGIQSHMQAQEWTLDKAWNVCQTYARFGLPIHFTELTVVSGPHKPKDTDWYTYRKDWHATPAGERRQARYLARFYTLLFSHPAVEAITYWGLRDPLWLGSPGGFLRADGSPKPSYTALRKLIRKRWWTNVSGVTDASGTLQSRVFGGEHRVTVTVGQRQTTATLALRRRSSMEVRVTAAGQGQ
jgi:GH35 family endo-1,4-beta-xylanase